MSKVLYVEDVTEQRDFIKQILELNGFEVNVARNGLKGIEKARTWLPDLILMDVRMPHMDGVEAIKTLRSEDQTAHIPIIVISAYTSARDRSLAFAAGADGFLEKPVFRCCETT